MSLEVAVRHAVGALELDVDVRLPADGVTVVFGPSGAGKSSLLAIIAGLVRPREGRIVLDGRTMLDTASGMCTPPHQRKLGMVFQDARLFPHLTVRSNLVFGATRRGGADAEDTDRIANLLDITHLFERRPVHLSGGERQRVALGRALLSRPDVLLLDEPLAALDGPLKAEILPYLERVRDGTQLPMLYVTHSLEETQRLADEVLVLERGRVKAHGTVFDVMVRADLAALSQRADTGVVLETHVRAHHAIDRISELAFDGGVLVVPIVPARLGSAVRARIEARDVTLALEEPKRVSANNVLACTVAGVTERAEGQADVLLRCGEVHLISRVTQRSVRRLGLAVGMTAHALIKSVIVDRGAGPYQQTERPTE